jgi:PAS domain S-box-containing protein
MAKAHEGVGAAFASDVVDQMPVAVTVIGLDGTVLYYNDCAAKMLDRKPEFVGRDVRTFHKPESAKRIEGMIEEFRAGRREEFHFEAPRGESTLAVTVGPLFEGGSLAGCIHCVWVKR